MEIIYRVLIIFLCTFFIVGCAAIPYLTRIGATELISAGGITLTLGDVAIYFIADEALESVIEDLGAFCPDEFQNKSYCVLIGTDGDKLTGNLYIQGNVNNDILLSIETINNPVTCSLPKGNNLKEKVNCNINKLEKLDNVGIKVIEGNTHFYISKSSLKKGLVAAKDSEIIYNLKKGRKAFKFFK